MTFTGIKKLKMSDFHIAEIRFGTPEYDEAVRLRYDILRKPLGLFYNPEDLAIEYDQVHIGCYNGHQVLTGYLNLTPLTDKIVKMRQVAVAAPLQGQGIGRLMVAYAEQWAQQSEFLVMELNARENAIPFYLRLNYEKVGDRFEEVGIPHFKMKKML